VRRAAALPLASRRLGLAGVADLVEFHRCEECETPFPVEFKRGKPKAHRADEVQLCAQALCLEEMTDKPVPEGALFYAETRRRLIVPFDEELRQLTEAAAASLRDLFASGKTPRAEYSAQKCCACSLIELCRPKASTRSANAWREREVKSALAAAAPVPSP
jgi:CRISPR-associated exonuclease Cas4